MRISKFFIHPVIVIFTIFAFSFLMTGCDRTVTKYDANGKPYSATEPDPGGTLAAYILTVIILGSIVACASSSGGGAHLDNPNRPMFAYAGNKGYITDASSGMYNPVKCFKIVDREGNIVSEHMIDVDKLLASRSVVNVSDVQVSSRINKKALESLVSEIAKANNLNSMPDSIKTEVSLADNGRTLEIDDVSIPQIMEQENRNSRLTVISERGVFKVSAGLNEKPDSQEAGQLSVTVSQLN